MLTTPLPCVAISQKRGQHSAGFLQLNVLAAAAGTPRHVRGQFRLMPHRTAAERAASSCPAGGLPNSAAKSVVPGRGRCSRLQYCSHSGPAPGACPTRSRQYSKALRFSSSPSAPRGSLLCAGWRTRHVLFDDVAWTVLQTPMSYWCGAHALD